MKIYYECPLADFNAWSGAKSRLGTLRELGKVDELEQLLEDVYPEGLSETELNDILWFEDDQYCEALDIADDEWY